MAAITRSQSWYTRVTLCCICLLALGGGFVWGTSAASTTDLAPTLEQLIEADQPETYAENQGLVYQNDSVQVIVETTGNGSVVNEYAMSIESQYQQDNLTLVQAFVPLDHLRPLAAESAVTYIRPPKRGVPDPSPATNTPMTAQPQVESTTSTLQTSPSPSQSHESQGLELSLAIIAIILILVLIIGWSKRRR